MSDQESLNASADQKKPKRKKKEKKQAIHLSLWINCVAYEFGQVCTFCTKVKALVHCKECSDFYCGPCDTTAHKTKKRKLHIRQPISFMDIPTAGGYVARYTRRSYLIKQLQKICRVKIRRFFDRVTLNHYYYNSTYGTVSWKKPYILRKEELFPFMDIPIAASRVQGLYHCWRSRDRVRKLMLEQYKRIFDRQRGYFYYAYNGASRIIPSSSWRKPKYCGKRSYPYDIPTVFTVDVAAVVIQRKWRSTLLREFFRAMARSSYEQVWDPVKGRWNYVIKERQILLEYKPKVMRKQPWDPNNVMDWSNARVSIFIRRLGLKHLVQQFSDYGVTGKVLLLLDYEDYENMGVHSKVTIRKIQIELARIYKADMTKIRMSDEHAARREKIRKAKLFAMAAKRVQKNFRSYLLRKEIFLRVEIRRVRAGEERRKREIATMGVWWINREDIPSKQFSGSRVSISDLPDTGGHFDHFSAESTHLPPIKTFGRRRDHLSCRGWGRFTPDNDGGSGISKMKWVGVVMPDIHKISEVFHPSRIYTHKIATSGYDERRKMVFKGLSKTLYNPAINRQDLLGDHNKKRNDHEVLL